MITDADIEKLKGTFATKDYVDEVFATKLDLYREMSAVHARLDGLEARTTSTETKLDAVIEIIEEIRSDQRAMRKEHRDTMAVLRRHDREIGLLADEAEIDLRD